MKLILPDGVRLKIVRKGRTARFVYEEDFKSKKLVKRSFDALTPILKAVGLKGCVIRSGKSIRISGEVDYAMVANMMVTEFMSWSTIGEMSLRDLMGTSLYNGVRVGVSAAKPPILPEHKD